MNIEVNVRGVMSGVLLYIEIFLDLRIIMFFYFSEF